MDKLFFFVLDPIIAQPHLVVLTEIKTRREEYWMWIAITVQLSPLVAEDTVKGVYTLDVFLALGPLLLDSLPSVRVVERGFELHSIPIISSVVIAMM